MKKSSLLVAAFLLFIITTGWAGEQDSPSLPNSFSATGMLTIDGGRARESTIFYDGNNGKAAIVFKNSKIKDSKILFIDANENILVTKIGPSDPSLNILGQDKVCFQESYKKGLPSLKDEKFNSNNESTISHAFGDKISQLNISLNSSNELEEINTTGDEIGKISFKAERYSVGVPDDAFSNLGIEKCAQLDTKFAAAAPQELVFNTMPGRCLNSDDREIGCTDSIFSSSNCGFTDHRCTDDEKGCYCLDRVSGVCNYGRYQGLGRYRDGCGVWDWVDCAARNHDRHICADGGKCKTDCANNCNYKAALLYAYNKTSAKRSGDPWYKAPVTHDRSRSLEAAKCVFANGAMQTSWFFCACDWPAP